MNSVSSASGQCRCTRSAVGTCQVNRTSSDGWNMQQAGQMPMGGLPQQWADADGWSATAAKGQNAMGGLPQQPGQMPMVISPQQPGQMPMGGLPQQLEADADYARANARDKITTPVRQQWDSQIGKGGRSILESLGRLDIFISTMHSLLVEFPSCFLLLCSSL